MTAYEKTGSLIAGGSQASSHHVPTAYLDTNLVSALARQHIHVDEVAALFALVDLMHEGHICLVTSRVTKEEIDQVPLEHRAPHEGTYALLRKIPIIDEQRPFPRIIQPIRAGGAQFIHPPVVEEEELGRLRAILPDENDARHVFQALKNGAAYFVTADRKTILSHAREIESAFTIRVVAATQLVAELTANDAS